LLDKRGSRVNELPGRTMVEGCVAWTLGAGTTRHREVNPCGLFTGARTTTFNDIKLTCYMELIVHRVLLGDI